MLEGGVLFCFAQTTSACKLAELYYTLEGHGVNGNWSGDLNMYQEGKITARDTFLLSCFLNNTLPSFFFFKTRSEGYF